MKKFGLIGTPLTHSFSQNYFTEKFAKLGLTDYSYQLFPLNTIDELTTLLQTEPHLCGLNVTIPYKQSVIPFLTDLHPTAQAVGAVNTIHITNSPPNVGGEPRQRLGEGVYLTGYNTDVLGFAQAIKPLPISSIHHKALIIGTGGSSKAVAYVLKNLGIDVFFLSRNTQNTNTFTYDFEHIEALVNTCKLIVNCTPVGMHPNINQAPAIPYNALTNQHICIDLVYNPAQTQFMVQAAAHGVTTTNGLTMLHAQADEAFKIWCS